MPPDRLLYDSYYRFLDTNVAISSTSVEFLGLFGQLYRRFLLSEEVDTQARYLLLPDEGRLVVDGEVLTLDDPDALLDRAYERILDSIVARVRSHILIHAGVVSRDGQGLVFPAYSGHGKTTLILELVRRGLRFLSDEIAAFDRSQGVLVPFPRSLRVRPGTLALCGYSSLATPMVTWRGKLVVDVESLQPNSLGQPCPGTYLIILANPVGGQKALGSSERELATAVSELPFVPDFQSVPKLVPISGTEATMELIRGFRGGPRSALLQEDYGGRATRLFVELAEIVRTMRCYRLYVGRLSEMADLVCSLVENSGGAGMIP